MEKPVIVWKLYSNQPETKDFCLFEVKTCDKLFAMKEIQDYCFIHGLSSKDHYVRKEIK